MSQVIGLLILATIAARLCVWLWDEIRRERLEFALGRVESRAYQEYRANQPIDRVGTYLAMLGPQAGDEAVIPLAGPSSAEAEKILRKREETRRAIGSVHVAAKMAPCDEVTRPHFYTDRDFGDESPTAF